MNAKGFWTRISQQVRYMYLHTRVCLSAPTHPFPNDPRRTQNPPQAAITNLSILQERWNLFSILRFVRSPDKELWRSTQVTKIKELVTEFRLEKNQIPCLLVHSTAPIWDAYHTHSNPLFLLALCPDHLISYHLILAATHTPFPFAFRKFSIPWHKRGKMLSFPIHEANECP